MSVKKWTVKVEITIELDLNKGVDIDDAMQELDYSIATLEEHGTVRNTEMTDYTIIV